MEPTSPEQNVLKVIIPPAKILAIDNKPDELENIIKGFQAACIPCVPLLYDTTEGLEKKDYINISHARFVFMDLNLMDIEITHKPEIVGYLIDAIDKLGIIGPYALIFWTKHAGDVHGTMRLLKERMTPKFNLPFFYCTMDKTQLSLPPKEEDEGKYQQKLKALTEEIKKIFSTKLIFSSIVAWENKVTEAASDTLKALHDTVRVPQKTGLAQDEKEFTRLLKIVASSAWGKQAAKDKWGHSVASGLSPFLSDNLDYGISSDISYEHIWQEALGNDSASKLPKSVPAHSLNASCVLDATCKNKDAYGTWLRFTIKLDSSRFSSVFGTTGLSLMEEFINFSFEKESGVKFSKEAELGLLDITRACDYANRKHGLRRFVLGCIIPAKLRDYIKWELPNDKSGGEKKFSEKRHDAIYTFPCISLEVNAESKQENIIQLNYKYVLSLPDKSPLLSSSVVTPRFRVRRQILTDIIAKFGAHTTSPGIISFR